MSQQFPSNGELVVATCTKVTDHGAYFEIHDYEHLGEGAGFIHVSELSKTWVRNIRSEIREGRRIVAKILRIDRGREEIDMSIRRTSDSQRRERLTQFKQETRARGIVSVACENDAKVTGEINSNILFKTGSVYDTLMRARDDGVKFLISLEIPKDTAEKLHQLALKELEPPTVSLIGNISLTLFESNGAELLGTLFKKYKTTFISKQKGSTITMGVISAPDYRVQIESKDWRTAENMWKKSQDFMNKFLKPYDSEVEYTRTE